MISYLNSGRVFLYSWASGAAEGSYPQVALLRVGKTVHMEAELFLSSQHVRLF